MHPVQTGPWDPRPPSKDATPPLLDSRGSRVTSDTPAKRITFYRSGDSQFGGVRMAIHKRSFKCFDALLDDLSQKVPLPFGVRTVTTPRGTHTIKHLEQLQDGGCYLCSDRRQAKPINMQLASKCQGTWYHHSRRPRRPESSSSTPPGHLHLLHRQRRILLVRNSEPGTRRSIVLSRRSARSLKAFLDEASEAMQFHVRKLYTVEGRRIDNVQSLMTCPAVLVCVGRETFSPVLFNFIRKTSEEKLPSLGSKSPGLGPRVPGNGARSPSTQGVRSPRLAQSRASEYDEVQKNNNFGLETKKSIIHPRSDSSNRSTRFSMSSEKSYGVGSQARPAIMNDDIEKRVLVNKDGSLSVEMRVRFRLQNEETIQWSTQIKKSPSLTYDCCPLSQTQSHYLQQSQSESCSDPDSTSNEGVDYSKCAENHCPCCYQGQNNQFDLWENPTNKHRPVPPTHTSNHTAMRHARSSSSSSCNSRRMVQCRAQLSGSPGGLVQSQFVQKETSVTEQVEHSIEVDRDGVEVCKVSRCCSRTEVVTVDADLLPPNRKAAEGELTMGQDENRPLSAVSSSSRVLQSLKEDQDDDEDDLPPSASQCSNRTEPIPAARLDEEPTSNVNSVHSVKHRSHTKNNKTESRASLAASTCHCGAATPHSSAGTDQPNPAPSSSSTISKPRSERQEAADIEVKDANRAASSLSHHNGQPASTPKSWMSDECPNCGGWKRVIISPHPVLLLSNKENDNNCCDDVASTCSQKISPTINGSISAVQKTLEERAPSATSTASNPNSKGRDEGRAPRSTSATSHRSNMSHKSNCNGVSGVTAEQNKERSPGAVSAQSNLSRKSKCTAEAEEEKTVSLLLDKSSSSVKFPKTNCPLSTKEAVSDTEEGDTDKRAPSLLSVRSNASAKSGKAESYLSNKSKKSNVSAKSRTPDGSIYNQNAKAISDEPTEGATAEERSTSRVSVKSNTSHKSTKTSERPPPGSETEEDIDKRSTILQSSKCNYNEKASSSNLKIANNADDTDDKNIEEETKSKPGSIASINSNNDKRSASARSVKSTKSHGTKTEVDRYPSTTSGRSSAKSSKSHRSNHMKTSLHQCDADVLTTETNGDETENRKDPECDLSVTFGASHESNLTGNLTSPNIAIIKTPEGPDEEETDTNKQEADLLHDSNDKTADIAVIETNSDSCGQTLSPRRRTSSRTRSPKAASPKLNDGEQRLGRSRCCCGVPSAPEKRNKEKEEDKEDRNYGETSERATSILSSSSKRQRKPSGGTEIPLSHNSSGSISLGLQEDQEVDGSDSGKSGISFHKKPEKSSLIEDANRSESTSHKEITSANVPAVDIPTIKTPKGEEEGEEGGEQVTQRAASASTVKSNRSHKSRCNCSTKASGQILDGNVEETKSVKSTSTTNASKMDTLSRMSGNDTVQRKSSSRAGGKNAPKETANMDTENQDTETNEKEGISQNEARSICSQSSLRPESMASAQHCKATHGSVKSGFNPVKSHKTQSQTESKEGSPCPVHNPRPSSKTKAGSEFSAAAGDQRREATPAACRHSKSSKTSDKPRSEKSEKSQKSRNLKDLENAVEFTLECLPNKSPNEVVSDWLQSIPANSSMLTFDHELNEEVDNQRAKQMAEIPGEEIGATEVSPDVEQENKDENAKPQEEDKEQKVDYDAEGPMLGDSVKTSSHSKNWQYSAAVMKVLLSSSFGRCRSMPEVSPIYGHRLSTSARGLLDCLAQLQLIEPAVGCDSHQQKECKQQYDEVMAILQSLWLHEPRDIKAGEVKDIRGLKQVTPPRSSSGVGMSSGSDGSGKRNGNQGEDEMCKEKEAVEKEGGNGKARDKDTEMEHKETFKADKRKSEDESMVPQSQESQKTTENTSSSEKNSAIDSFGYPTDNKRETQENVHSGTPRAPLSKRLSQDPDPVWVLQLLQKLEKQFMRHYIQAMAEFKVRWDLDDSIILDAMITELRDEVSRRIQSSIQHEMKKIQSRAGKGGKWPRPPQLASISRDSTMTEKRRRIMKVIKNQSVKTADSVSDEEMTGSDQRSDDDYCPCDACIRKKMAARPLKKNPLAAECPVMMEFDLRKILQLKKSPAPATVTPPQPAEEEDEETRNLERVEEEEEEETKVNTKTDDALEETIPEEVKKVEQDKNKPEERKEKDEEHDEGEMSARDETSENGEEEEEVKEDNEEEEGGCTCPSAKDEEESSKEEEEETSNCTDDETGEEEESDKETVKEATAGKEELTLVEEAVMGNVSVETEDGEEEDDETEEGESHDEETGSESEEQDEEVSEEECALPQSQAELPAGTEGEEADIEDSDTSTEESGHEEAGGSGDNKEDDSEEKEENIVEEFKDEDKSEEEEAKNQDGTLLYQFTRTSVESQPGSMEDGNADLISNPVDSTKALKVTDDVAATR